ncbi:MAG TPA: hypothetical protein VFZ59_13480 [Verrucomicrobiae bacterium]|nr:hypothetical protein [Verrucomicrobiae bacterium]
MSPPSASLNDSSNTDAVFPQRPMWESVFSVALALSLLAAFLIKSNKTYLGHDDLCTTTLVANPNFGQMLETIRSGGEVNPPLLFVIGWSVARVFGTGELPMRALSAIPLILAAVVTFRLLRRSVGWGAAALATAMVFGLSRAVFDLMQTARYYGLLVLLGALAASVFLNLSKVAKPGWPLLLWVFLIHSALVWLHLFGLFFSGMWLAALVVSDWLRGKRLIRVYAAVLTAWATFVFWVPALKVQLQVTRDGTWTPRMPFGLFVDEPAMQTPLATVMLILAALALVAVLTKPEEGTLARNRLPSDLVSLLILSLSWMAVTVATWAGSYVTKPFYMQRYVAPCLVALTVLVALGAWLVKRLPGSDLARLPVWARHIAWGGAILLCLLFQPLRALSDSPRPDHAFEDFDFGHPNLPIVFEDSMDYLVRAYYGQGREYALIIDRDAAEADPGYFTKLTERYFSKYRPYYRDEVTILYADDLPTWPKGFLAIDCVRAKTWEWLFAHQPGWKVEWLGTWPTEQKVYLVQRQSP